MMNKMFVCVFVAWTKLSWRVQLVFFNFIDIKNMKHKGTPSIGVRRKSHAFQLMALKQVSVWTKAFLAMLWVATGEILGMVMVLQIQIWCLQYFKLMHIMYHQQSLAEKKNSSAAWSFYMIYVFIISWIRFVPWVEGEAHRDKRKGRLYSVKGLWKRRRQ